MGQSSAATGLSQTRPELIVGVVDVDILNSFSDLVLELGGDPEILLRNCRIDPEALNKRGAILEFRLVVHLLQHCADELACPDFGMRLAATQDRARALGPIGVVMRNSRNVQEATDYCTRNMHAYSIATRAQLLPFSPQHQAQRLDIMVEGLLDKRQAMEHALLLSALSMSDMTGGAAKPSRVLLAHQPMASRNAYQDFFGCEVSFGQRMDALILSDADLQQPILHPDAMVYEMATTFIANRFPLMQAPIHACVRSLILRYLGNEDCTNERIAAELLLHPRTLQRRLRAEGTSFDEIKDEARRDVAWHYIKQSDLPMTQVAERLGYAEASVLSRSCYRWFATSPRQLRVKIRTEVVAEGF